MLVATDGVQKRYEIARTSHKLCPSHPGNRTAELHTKHSIREQNNAMVTTKNAKLLELSIHPKTQHGNVGLRTSLAGNPSKLAPRDITPNLAELYPTRFGNQSSLIIAKQSADVSHGKYYSQMHQSKRNVELSTKLHRNIPIPTNTQRAAVLNSRRVPKLIKASPLDLSHNYIPEITHLTSSANTNFRPKLSSILSQNNCHPQTNPFTWVKYRIPNPPPNLEEVERKLYPHRFKIRIGEIPVFSRIPSPPPHMPEAISFPLQELIPSPPPDIPRHLLGLEELPPQKIRIRTGRTPNPILSIIPAPPPDLPGEVIFPSPPPPLICRDCFGSSGSWDSDQDPPITPPLPLDPATLHALHLQEIVRAAELREKERDKSKYKKAKLTEPNFHQLHLEEVRKIALDIEQERTKLTFPPPPPPFIRGDSSDSSGSWDSDQDSLITAPLPLPLDPATLHALHLQEIVRAAEMREKERDKSKYKKAILTESNFHQLHLEKVRKIALDRGQERTKLTLPPPPPTPLPLDPAKLHALHLQEIVRAAELREMERNKSKYKKAKLTEHNFHQLHLEEVRKIALDRGQERIIKERKGLKTEEATGYTKGPSRPFRDSEQNQFCSSSLPDLARCYNHMSQCLTPQMYDRLSQLRTGAGFRIDQAIQTGVDNPGDPHNVSVGCVAGDEESYSLFRELFDLVIYSSHHGYTPDRIHCSDLDPIGITDGYFDPNYVWSCRVLGGRSIRGYPLLPHCTRNERRGVESVAKECICNMPHPFKGRYYSLKEIAMEDREYLNKRKFLFNKPVSPSVIAARMTRDWPDARGFWLNRDESFMAWVNQEDHVRLISMEEGGDLRSAFERYCLGVQLFEMTVSLRGYELMKNNHIGYILTCPSNLGTGMIITLFVRLPMLLSFHGLGIVLGYLNLEKQGVNTETGEFQISNIDSLGMTEVEITQKIIHGVHLLISIEKTLWSGLCLQEFLREVNPELANLLLVGTYHRNPVKRITVPKYLIPMPPPAPRTAV